MPTDVLMPKLADTLVEGTLTRWLKAANDAVQAGEPIAEIETDKVTTELTAPTSGTLSELLIAEGTTVPIGTALVRILAQGEQELSPEDHAASSAKPVFLSTGQAMQETAAKRTSPLAARIAQAHGVNLAQVNASGSRITRADVERHLVEPGQVLPAPVQPIAEQAQQEGRSERKDATVPVAGTSLVPASSLSTTGEVLSLTGLRRATAARMTIVRQIPTGCAVVEADVTAIEQFYREERGAWLERFGFPLTYTPFFLYALAQTLRVWPAVRVAIRDGQREPREGVHVGVAVALDDGLIVPVIGDADRQDMQTLARSQAELVARARARRLRPDEVTGGVATITNVGSMAGLLALPMLNENQAVMLGVGAITRRAVGASDGIRYRSCVYLSLTFDRRLLDDLQAERFLVDVRRRLELQWQLEAKGAKR